jgi:hypothetical protein
MTPPHRIRRLFPPPPLFIPWIKHPLNRAISSPIYHWLFVHLNHRPPPSPRPQYKGRASLPSTAPLPALLLFSPHPSAARTECLIHQFFTTVARSLPPLRRPLLQLVKITTFPSPFFLSHGDAPHTGAPFRLSSAEPPPRPYARSTKDRCRPWSTSRRPSPRLFPLANKSKIEKFPPLCIKAPVLVQY